MYCEACGTMLDEGTRFCAKCGAPQGVPPGGPAGPLHAHAAAGLNRPLMIVIVALVVGLLAMWLISSLHSSPPPNAIGPSMMEPSAISLGMGAATGIGVAAGAAAGMGFLFVLIGLAIVLVADWKIAAKAGYHGALSLLLIIPLVNIAVFLFFAFGEWPIERELKELRARTADNK